MATSMLELQEAAVPYMSFFLPDQEPPSRSSTSSLLDTSMAYADHTGSFDQDMVPEILNYLLFDEDDGTNHVAHQSDQIVTTIATDTSSGSTQRTKSDGGRRIGFRTKTEVDVLDDGYKWKKYGKKSVKNSPNPRNYFRCSDEGCEVKKRVERDGEDNNYVITTYCGVHNHDVPARTAADGGKQLSHGGLVWPPPHHDSPWNGREW